MSLENESTKMRYERKMISFFHEFVVSKTVTYQSNDKEEQSEFGIIGLAPANKWLEIFQHC